MTADDPTPQTTDEQPDASAPAVDETPIPDAEEIDAEEVESDEGTPEEPTNSAEVADAADDATPPADAPPATNKKWYIVKVTSGREESIKAAIERRVKIEGLEEFFGQVHIPVERVTEIKKVRETKNGEKVTKERRVTKEKKKYPGYIMAEVEFNDRILYLFRETSGVGDFVGAGGPSKPPPPMTEIEVKRMLGEPGAEEPGGKKRKTVVKLDFEKGDKVRIREGAFSNMEGEVKEITEPKEAGETPKVTVEVQIFGRPVGVELDYWQVDKN
jgi:transcription termination/antitermination protein NusG